MNLGTAFDRLTNVVLIAAVAYGIYSSRQISSNAAPMLPAYAVGEKVPQIANIDYSKADTTLIVFLRSGCVFCQRSVPFYKELIRDRNAQQAPVQVVAVSLEDQLVLDTFLRDYNLAVDRSATILPTDWRKLASTPTLIAVDRSGTVKVSWVGQLGVDDERKVRGVLGL